MKLSSIGGINHVVDQYTKEMKLTQAGQFDGPINKQIEDTAVDAWARDFDYAEYCHFAARCNDVHGTTLTTLSQPEYKALCDKWETSMAADFNQQAIAAVLAGAKGIVENVIADATITGTGVMSVHVDENDNILMQHWDSNILFNQRNHTE